MEKVIINSYEEFEKLVGQQIGVSDYVELSQERINLFADATLDHQWIHVAKAEIKFAIEIKDQPKKALEGIAVFLYYFN